MCTTLEAQGPTKSLLTVTFDFMITSRSLIKFSEFNLVSLEVFQHPLKIIVRSRSSFGLEIVSCFFRFSVMPGLYQSLIFLRFSLYFLSVPHSSIYSLFSRYCVFSSIYSPFRMGILIEKQIQQWYKCFINNKIIAWILCRTRRVINPCDNHRDTDERFEDDVHREKRRL